MNNKFKVGELLHKRSPFSKTWINFDGSYTMETFNEVVHYEDDGGQLRTVNPMLSRETDTDDYQGIKVPFDARVPHIFSTGYAVGHGDEQLIFTPVGARKVRGKVNPDKINEIIYRSAWTGTDVKLEVTANSLKETIILKTEKAPTTFQFIVDGGTDGNLQLAPAWLTDANGVYRDVEQVVKDGIVTLTVDTDGLAFPIEVDPTIFVGNLVGAKNDNTVYSNNSDGVYLNEQSVALLSNDIRRIYSKYPNMIKGIPTDAKITKATLTVYASGFDGTLKFRVHAVASDYNPDTLTWRSQPLISDNLVSPEVTLQVGSPSWNPIDITSIVQAKLDGTQVSALVMKSSNLSSGGDATIALSNNQYSGTRPFITVEFNAPPSKPTVVSPNGGETVAGSQAITWTAANDIRDYTEDPFIAKDSIIFSNKLAVGQSFTMNADNALIKRIYLRLGVSNSGLSYKMSLYHTNGSTGYWLADKSRLVAQGDVVFESGTSPVWCYADLPSVAVTKGNRYAIVIEAKDGSSVTYQMSRTDTYRSNANGCAMVQDSTSSTFAGFDMDFLYKIVYSSGEAASQLRYNVQLSSDSGSTWKDIIPLSFAGATSQSYNFGNELETSTAKVRVRAYDGVSYGPWDESDGVFTISQNDPPGAPDNLAPNGTSIDRSKVTRMSWRHNDPDGNDPQSKFEINWRMQGSSSWTVVTQNSVNQYYDAPTNTFPAGKIEWRVRTYDQGGLVGPYSTVTVFTAAGTPTTPIITSPANNSTLPDANPTITWSHPDQVQYRVRVFKTSDNSMVFEAIKISPNKALTITTALANSTAYYVNVAIADSSGLWSNDARVNITISYTQPNTPTLSATVDNINGTVSLSVLNPFATGNTPRTDFNEFFRKTGNGEWIKVQRLSNPNTGLVNWTDRMPTPNATEVYKVRAVGSNGAYVDSSSVTVVVSLRDTQLAVASNTLSYVTLRKREGSKEVTGRKSVSSDFVGRPYPMTEFGSNLNRSMDYRYKVENWDDVLQIREYAQLGEAFILRDNWGKKDFVTFDTVNIDEGRTFWYVSIHLTKVYYQEAIE
ncbi:virion structural protein [Bacillus phage Wes44]|uniref:Putative YD repeat protein n=1 Tax=Bacillus phage Wes44 TaxID=2283012 RepID=A0A346FK45_9CAUD|nr:virion structural protein [Bacillus phage Wes44]AXN58350.1 putative YD repeat protein [Bacillus phage Wes44]